VRTASRPALGLAAALLVATAGSASVVASFPVEGPVNVQELLALARRQQALNTRLYYQYAFKQTTLRESIGPDGRVRRAETLVYDVIPFPDGTERHLLSKDGEEPPQRLVRKQEGRNEKVQQRYQKMRAEQEREAERHGRVTAGRPQPAAAQPSPPARPTPAGQPPTRAPTAPPTAASTAAAGARQAPIEDVAPHAPAFQAPDEGPPSPPPPDPVPPCAPEDPASRVRLPRPGPPPVSRAATPRPPGEERRKRESTGQYTIFELLSLTDYTYVGTCEYRGRTVHVLSFQPPADFDPQNPVERVAMAMKGTLLVDAADLQVMRAEGRTVAPIKWGAGLVALRAAHVIFEHEKVRDEVWLPSRHVFDFDARVVFDSDHERTTHAFSDYRKFEVSTEQELGDRAR
jgi:hypothetical protein